MKIKILLGPIFYKLAFIIFISIWLLCVYLWITDEYIKLTQRETILSYISSVVFCFILYYILVTFAALKIDDNKIYIFRFYKWEQLDLDKIKSVSYSAGKRTMTILVDGINLINQVVVPIDPKEGWYILDYIRKLLSAK